jgi:hypothetical protein
MSNWVVESHRLTLFRFPGTSFDVEGVWRAMAGREPDELTKKAATGKVSASGVLAGGRLIVQHDPLRVDVVYFAAQAEDEIGSRFPELGPVGEQTEMFVNLTTNFLRDAPEALRLAYGLVLGEQATSKMDAYLKLGKRLPTVRLDAENSTDFSYQINRPRSSKVLPGLSINRLSQWACNQLVHQMIAVQNGSRLEVLRPPEAQTAYRCRLELDLSTSQDRREALPSDRVPNLFMELVELAREISEMGDVA